MQHMPACMPGGPGGTPVGWKAPIKLKRDREDKDGGNRRMEAGEKREIAREQEEQGETMLRKDLHHKAEGPGPP